MKKAQGLENEKRVERYSAPAMWTFPFDLVALWVEEEKMWKIHREIFHFAKQKALMPMTLCRLCWFFNMNKDESKKKETKNDLIIFSRQIN